jgi:site-specific recombinase XerD
MTQLHPIGSVVHSFFEDFLKVQKGLRVASIRSYRDVLRLFLCFSSKDAHCRISRLSLQDLTFDRVLRFLKHLEEDRKNDTRTRNHRLAALHVFFEYIAGRQPEMLATCQRVAAIPYKRTPPPETQFLEREEIAALMKSLPSRGRHALRDRALLLFLYNTGARVQEVADVRVENLDLGSQARVRLHGKGGKWRVCPLWSDTLHQIKLLLEQERSTESGEDPVFTSRPSRPLTRFGIYKIVRRHTKRIDARRKRIGGKHISPHTFRHSAAVHLLESGVEVNVIRGWLGHVSLETTNRYAEISIRTKEAAVRACEPPIETSTESHRSVVWKDDEALLAWLNSL